MVTTTPAAKATDALSDRIDAVWLTRCEDPVAPRSSAKRDVIEAEAANGARWRACRLTHNGLVDILERRQQAQ